MFTLYCLHMGRKLLIYRYNVCIRFTLYNLQIINGRITNKLSTYDVYTFHFTYEANRHYAEINAVVAGIYFTSMTLR